MENVKSRANEIIAKYPQSSREVHDLVEMCMDEIDDGGSEFHEVDICLQSLDELEVEYSKKECSNG